MNKGGEEGGRREEEGRRRREEREGRKEKGGGKRHILSFPDIIYHATVHDSQAGTKSCNLIGHTKIFNANPRIQTWG